MELERKSLYRWTKKKKGLEWSCTFAPYIYWVSTQPISSGRAMNLFEHAAHLYDGDKAAPTASVNVPIT